MVRWDFYCCSADGYRWLRDTQHIDREDYELILAYCPPIMECNEPDEWRDLKRKRD